MQEQKLTPPNYLTYPAQPSAIGDDEIDLRELFRALWKGSGPLLR
ncbi:chain length determinant family protein [Vibrio cholerae]|nr:hypothetical protein [Vibrio cholerae]GHY31324.1 chain length determinant family protein [Vibrio cholerae]